MAEEKETLENFEGFDANSIEFFGESADGAIVVDEPKKKETEDTTDETLEVVETDDKKDKENEDTEDTPDINFFDEEENEDGESTDDKLESGNEGGENEEPRGITASSTLTFLKDKGLVDFELEEGEELTDEKAEEILEDSYDEAIETRLSQLMKDLPDDVKNIVKYSLDGGNVQSLISQMSQSPAAKIDKDLDLENETNQSLVVKTARIEAGEDEETAEAYVEFLKESGKLKGVAEKEHQKIVSSQAKLAAENAKRQAEAKKQAKENHRKFKSEISSFVSESDELDVFKVTRKDKRELPSYISDATVKLENGRVVTELQKDLYLALNDKEKTVKLAKILKSNFDFSDIAKAEKTKFTKEVKRDLSRSKKTTETAKKSNKSNSLADFF
jgi:hypothetical protein